MKVLTVLGARPQFIKAAVVSRSIASLNEKTERKKIHEVIVHTGQHYDANMSDVFFKEMDIPAPDYHLGVCNASHGVMTGKMLEGIENVLVKEKPDVVLVYGDTNSTLAGALAAAKLHILVAHVEAGLRSFNMLMPEEINRILTDRISSILFCPTEGAVRNLTREGIQNWKEKNSDGPMILNVGDVMYDAALFYRSIAKPTEVSSKLLGDIAGKEFYLVTVHRAENTDDEVRLRNIVGALEMIAQRIPVVWPLHPRTRKIARNQGLRLAAVKVLDPVGYFDMITLLERCKAVFTDSGGLQKEAYFFHKQCVTLRDETEWTELVDHGFNTLAGASRDRILDAEKTINGQMSDFSKALYGTGNAGENIVRTLVERIP